MELHVKEGCPVVVSRRPTVPNILTPVQETDAAAVGYNAVRINKVMLGNLNKDYIYYGGV